MHITQYFFFVHCSFISFMEKLFFFFSKNNRADFCLHSQPSGYIEISKLKVACAISLLQ